jgi:uncharacterized protein YdcH (DUF465 family)
MSTPEALRLADLLETDGWPDAAAELRRLHAEVECEERRFNQLFDNYDKLERENKGLREQNTELDATLARLEQALRQALAALKDARLLNSLTILQDALGETHA